MAALGLVSGLTLAADRTAEASIVYSGVENITVDSTNTSYALDLNNDSTADFTLAWSLNGLSLTSDITTETPASTNAVVTNGGYAAALGAGTLIGSSSTFGGGLQTLGTSDGPKGSVTLGGYFPNAGDKYLGLKFDISGQSHYGWALLNDTVGDIGGTQSLNIKGWAYDSTANQAIAAGETVSPSVPEPASLVQLALGAAGVASLSCLRRRRKPVVEA